MQVMNELLIWEKFVDMLPGNVSLRIDDRKYKIFELSL